jgi:hypothetical protein
LITSQVITEVLSSVENGKRQVEQERTLEINKACSLNESFVQLCEEIFLYGLDNQVDIINTIGAAVIAGIDMGLKIAKKEQETCLTNPSQIN